MKLCMRHLLHQFCMTLPSERVESNKTNANKVSYKASYKAPLTRKTTLFYDVTRDSIANNFFIDVSCRCL